MDFVPHAVAVSIFLMIPAVYAAEKFTLTSRQIRTLVLCLIVLCFLFFATQTNVALHEIWVLLRTGQVPSHAPATINNLASHATPPPEAADDGAHSEAPTHAVPSAPSLFTVAGIRTFCIGLKQIAELRFLGVVFLITLIYLTLQTFCIPGTVALNAALGALFGTLFGLPVGVLLGTIGASLCFGLSALFGIRLVEFVDHYLMHDKGLHKIRAQVHRNRSELFAYMLFLRLTPVLPNWLVNLASPIVQVPYRTFALATCAGIIPQTYLTVRFGAMVSDAAAVGSNGGGMKNIVTIYDTLFLCLIGVTVLVVSRLKKRFASPAGATSSSVDS